MSSASDPLPSASPLALAAGDAARLAAEVRQLLVDLVAALSHCGAESDDLAQAQTAVAQLDEPFLLVVAGEWNAGKSAVVNALLGERLLAEGPTPTTDRITVLRHRERAGDPSPGPGIATVEADAAVLRHLDVVDTPGTNAVLREHEAVARHFIPRADLVLFVTSADRPFTESEREFLTAIRDWGKKVAVVVNKIDILATAADLDQVQGFVAAQSGKVLELAPLVFPVSARRALAALAGGGDPREWEESRFGPLARWVGETLDHGERTRLKLLSPLKVGTRLAARHREVLEARGALLAADLETLSGIEEQLILFEEDQKRQLAFRLADVEREFFDLEERGTRFFAATLRLGRLPDLVNRAKVAQEFERQVVADLPRAVDAKVREIFDWLLQRDLEQWQGIAERVAERRAQRADRMAALGGRGFDADRRRILESVSRTAGRALEGYDRKGEADRLAEQAQLAAAGTAILEAGAVGLGAAVALTALDATGLLAASALAALGLVILPHRRRRADEQLRQRVGEVRARLTGALTRELGREIEKSTADLRDAVAPYTRFVRAERQRLGELREALGALAARGADLVRRIGALER
jgi:small GTP-binding protein